jgi:undecaprenyl diphosphate synthase
MRERTLIEELERRVRSRTLPRHVGVIMDGNGRWAEGRGLGRVAGHQVGSDSVRAVVRQARKLGIDALTLYAFSAQNWARPLEEVEALMQLLADFLDSERTEILETNIRLRSAGDIERLPDFVRERLEEVGNASRGNSGMVLTLALSYGGREELVRAIRALVARAPQPAAIHEETIGAELYTAGLPELDLVIRTGGERRLSNFLRQAAYAELHFVPTLWPDFRELEFLQAVADFQGRQRRFGLTGAQAEQDHGPE